MILYKQKKNIPLKKVNTRIGLKMSGKVPNVQRKPSESWRTVVQYHFKNDKKVWLLGNKMQRNKGVAQGFCTALCIQYVVFTVTLKVL